MARTFNEIYNSIIAGKETKAELNTLLPNPDNWSRLFTEQNFKLLASTIVRSLSQSRVAMWRLMVNIIAYEIYILENLLDLFKAEVQSNIDVNQFGQLQWYVKVSGEFQYGDDLVWDGSKYAYAVTDTDKQIITQASAHVANGQVVLKVAKGTPPTRVKLSTDEKNAFSNYIKGSGQAFVADGIAPAGTNIDVISDDADDLKLALRIFYNPTILSSTGVNISDGTTPVNDAINNYIQGLPFNSFFKIIDLVDAIQTVSGVDNVVVIKADARYGTIPYTDVLLTDSQSYLANAGYLKMATNHDLDGYYDYPTNTIRTLTFTES
jgi:hypothetical protein